MRLGASLTKYSNDISPIVLFLDSRYRFTKRLFYNLQFGYALPLNINNVGNLNNSFQEIDARITEHGIYANLGAGFAIAQLKRGSLNLAGSYVIQHIETNPIRTNIGYDRTDPDTIKGLQLTLSASW